VHAYAWKVENGGGGHIIASHQRCYGKGQDVMEVEHYLPVLVRRPGAFPYARPVRQWQMPRIYRDFLEALSRSRNGDSPRLFLQVLYLGRHFGAKTWKELWNSHKRGKSRRRGVRQLLTGVDTMPRQEMDVLLKHTRVVLATCSVRLIRTPETAARKTGKG
jgi:hypothetical protein